MPLCQCFPFDLDLALRDCDQTSQIFLQELQRGGAAVPTCGLKEQMRVGQTDLVALNVLKHPWTCGKAAIPIECRVGEDQVDLDAGVVDILLEQEEGRLDPMDARRSVAA